jgi:hypothetical protein
MITLTAQPAAPKAARVAKPITREQWLNRFTDLARPQFEAAGHPLPAEVRCSIGFPSSGVRSKVIGECWSSASSADGHAEIFLRPSLQSDTSRIADVLTHELAHAALGNEEGHGKVFGKLVRKLGLVGKLTATTAGPEWHVWADKIIAKLGPLPGASLTGGDILTGGKKKQTTRMLKLVCFGCDFTCRTSAAHIHPDMTCPVQGCGSSLDLENAS